ncbi:tRNA (guanine(37)-N(1))-methyltransferase isoform X1 [Calliopsis andreniformis]|uniref:tRNA (guanine(37)-N(1))-methyltransferase isoform X1 n=1 Tax=Calliopsis andreniformis TaxID=337506 RepID=UPI003FCEA889
MISSIRCTIINGCLIKQCFWVPYCFYNTTMTSLLVPPESVRGMTCLDRSAFTTTVELPCLKFRDIIISKITPIVKKYLFKMRNFKPIQNTNDETVIYLNPKLIQNFEDFSENERKQLSGLYEHFGPMKLTLSYDNWNTNDILKAILPEEIEVPTSYSLIGHIVHLNLRDMHSPYKNIIGQVLLDTIPSARTVVNKTNNIDTTFRHFAMEILAGDKNTVTVAKENGYMYELDFAQVYWNPRLSTEHVNLVTLMKPNDILYDVFAGVGPFAIPAARKGLKVFANDLNPESYKWLKKNVITNKVKSNFKSFNMDGRDFLRDVVKNDILDRRINNEIGSEHIVMNLPSLAVEFLDVFFDWCDEDEMKKVCCQSTIVHMYCFVKANKGEDACKLGQLLVEEKLGCPLNDSLINLHNVRNVSPYKEMIRVSFLLTQNILKGQEPAMKKFKIEDNSNVLVNHNIAENNGKEQGITKESKKQECIPSINSS